MGCSIIHTLPDLCLLRQIDSNLKISQTHLLYDSIQRAKDIIISINKLSKRLLSGYYNIINISGACVFVNPSIIHCLRCLFYKISADLHGNFDKAKIKHSEDPPYLTLSVIHLSKDIKKRLTTFLDFIIEIQSYKSLIKQLDKDIPDLLYLLFEENQALITPNNKEKIQKAVDSFQNLTKVRSIILKKYKIELYLYYTRNEDYSTKINKYGEKAIQKKITDIYEIAMLHKELSKIDPDIESESMYSTVDQAKIAINNLILTNNSVQIDN